MSNRRKTPSAGTVIAVVALFVALGSGAYAAKVAKNSVGASALKKNAVTKDKIKKAAVVNSKVAVGTLTANRLSSTAQTDLSGALAYGQVDPFGTGSYVAARTSGFTTLTNPAEGRWCLGVDSAIASKVFDASGNPTRPTVASVEYGTTPAVADTMVAPRGGDLDCGKNLLEINTYRGGAPSGTVAFTVVLP
ncbi:MAG: hypothetical protein FJW90_06570 [Actinobacteria bacterium]|nr:hypothetical protein [Actinomycetota bacterium]